MAAVAAEILHYGNAVSAAMQCLVSGMQYAQDIAVGVTDGIDIGRRIVKEAREALNELINDYHNGAGRKAMLDAGVESPELNTALQEMSAFLERIKPQLEAGGTMMTDTDLADFLPLYDKVNRIIKQSAVFNSDEWDMYEIMPPQNPTFKPKKILKIPDGMDLFEIACPGSFKGAPPVLNNCQTNPACAPCGVTTSCKVKCTKKKRKCKRKTTKCKKACDPVPDMYSGYIPRRNYYY